MEKALLTNAKTDAAAGHMVKTRERLGLFHRRNLCEALYLPVPAPMMSPIVRVVNSFCPSSAKGRRRLRPTACFFPGVFMRSPRFLLFLILAAAAPVAAAPRLGARTQAPQQIAPGTVDPEAEMRDAIAAADAHPLGSIANPVRSAGPEGERAYLSRLRCADGKIPGIYPRGKGGIGAYGSLVDLFALDCGAASPGRVEVAMDAYQEEHVETRALAGFAIAR
jgi:hypothetical protein